MREKLGSKSMVRQLSQSEAVATSAHNLNLNFGPESAIYREAVQELLDLWSKVSQEESILLKFQGWARNMENLYGAKPQLNAYIDHTYLVTLVKVILYRWLSMEHEVTSLSLEPALISKHSVVHRQLSIIEDGLFDWVFHTSIAERTLVVAQRIFTKLLEFDLSNVSEDLFKLIYQDLVERYQRHGIGEYYTPEWLVQLTLDKALEVNRQSGGPFPSIMDPACGSGTFLCNAIAKAKITLKEQGCSDQDIVQWLLSNIVGIDVNPLAVIISRANYLLALGNLPQPETCTDVPVHLGNILLPDTVTFEDHQVRFPVVNMLVGNPPWVVLRSIKNKTRQDLLKHEALRYGLVDKHQTHLFTQIDLATIFFCKASDIYLRNGGIIGFVMPRSVLSGTIHHRPFRCFKSPMMKLLKVLDLDNVHPLFNMPACVILARKGEQTEYPVPREKYSGELISTNLTLSQSQRILTVEDDMYTPDDSSGAPSSYYRELRVGASIFPRALYFVDLLSFDESGRIVVATSTEIRRIVKKPWNVRLTGMLEPHFIYSTLLAWEIVPFGHANFRPVVLPIKPTDSKYALLDVAALLAEGAAGAAEWWTRCEKVWATRRSETSNQRFPSLRDRLNYNGLLTEQNWGRRYCLVYTATGTNIASCVLDLSVLPTYKIHSQELCPAGFVADVKTWIYQTDIELEAHYLCAILNSAFVNATIKSWQPRGLLGPRAIHRRPFLLPIPRFDSGNATHKELAQISRQCHAVIAALDTEQTRNPRARARTALRPELDRVNVLVSEVLRIQVPV